MKAGGWAALAAAAAAIAVVSYATRPAAKPSLSGVIDEDGLPIVDQDGRPVLADELGNLYAAGDDGLELLGDAGGLGLSIFKRVVNEVKRAPKNVAHAATHTAKMVVREVKHNPIGAFFPVMELFRPLTYGWLDSKKHRVIAAKGAGVAALIALTIVTAGAATPALAALAPLMLSTAATVAVGAAGDVGAAVADHNHQLTQQQADEAAAAQAESPAPADAQPAPAMSWWDELFT